MNKFLSMIIFFLCCVTINAQFHNPKINVESAFYKLGSYGYTAEQIKFINNHEDEYVLDFDRDLIKKFPDTIANPEKIKMVSLNYKGKDTLRKDLTLLTSLPNVEYMELRTETFFRKNEQPDSLKLPFDIHMPKKLRFLKLKGVFEIDYNELFNRLKNIQTLEYLDIGLNNKPQTLPNSLLQLKQLKGLKALGFKKITFPDDLSELVNLEGIVLNMENYDDPTKVFRTLKTIPKLKRLHIENYEFTAKEVNFMGQLENIQHLTLFNCSLNNIQTLFDGFPTRNKLTTLNMQNMTFKKSPINYKKLGHLKNFTFNAQMGSSFKMLGNFRMLKDLRVLNLNYNNLKTINYSIAELKKLEHLDLSYNEIDSISPELAKLSQLKTLNLRNNTIKAVPSELSRLKDLEALDLSGNYIAVIPSTFGDLKKLKKLDLNINLLTKLPSEITFLSNLEIFHLNSNNLEELPINIGMLHSLKEFSLNKNFLKELPPSFANLTGLTSLQLRQNQLTKLPEGIGNLKMLREVLLGGRDSTTADLKIRPNNIERDNRRKMRRNNDLESLPESFSTLKMLERIDLENQKSLDTEKIFKVLFKLKSDRYRVDLSSCGITDLPENGWSQFYAESLNLAGNVIPQIPQNIIKAPFLNTLLFKRDKEDGLSYNFNDSNELLAFYEEMNFIPWQQIPKTRTMAEAYLNNAYNRDYTADKKSILSLFDKAFKIDSSYTSKKIRQNNYAEALMRNAHYERAIELFSSSIKKDTAQNIRVLNSLIPQFINRAQAYLKIGDTLSAIKDYIYLAEKEWTNDYGEAALLAKSIQNDTLANQLFEKGFTSYKQTIIFNAENNITDYGIQLSLLELYVIAEKFNVASSYLSQLKNKNITNSGHKSLMNFFDTVLKIITSREYKKEITNLKKILDQEDIELSSWSFGLLENWLVICSLETRKKESIRSIIKILENKIKQ